MSEPDTTTRYVVIHRDDPLWTAIDDREFEFSATRDGSAARTPRGRQGVPTARRSG